MIAAATERLIADYCASLKLTKREGDVVRAMLTKLTVSAQLADELNLSYYTLNNHLQRIYEKTNMRTKAEILRNFVLFIQPHLTVAKRSA